MMSENQSSFTPYQSVQMVELEELNRDAPSTTNAKMFSGNLELVEDIKIQVSVSMGKAELTVKDLFDLKEEATLTLDKKTNDPVDIYLDGKLVAQGVLVAVDDNFGVRVTRVNK
jgi:flagellar motor switch protein FliN/FliY